MRSKAAASTVLGVALTLPFLAPLVAEAHIGIAGPAIADSTQELTFAVGHGCENADTVKIVIDIPASVTTVRAVPSDFGKVTVNRDATNKVVSVTWEKPANAEVLASDDNFYKVGLRVKVPNAPFTPLYFPAHQTCKKADGTLLPVVDWASENQDAGHGNGPAPAPVVAIMPPRSPGWNKYTVPVALSAMNLTQLFADAEIVWKGTSAFSTNAATVDQIKATPGVTQLTTLAAGDEIWVKY
jgi:periplasmic copper chaperone A